MHFEVLSNFFIERFTLCVQNSVFTVLNLLPPRKLPRLIPKIKMWSSWDLGVVDFDSERLNVTRAIKRDLIELTLSNPGLNLVCLKPT